MPRKSDLRRSRNLRPQVVAIARLLFLKILPHKIPGDVAVAVGELVRPVLVLLDARGIVGKRQDLDLFIHCSIGNIMSSRRFEGLGSIYSILG